jgi:hypothetical protein
VRSLASLIVTCSVATLFLSASQAEGPSAKEKLFFIEVAKDNFAELIRILFPASQPHESLLQLHRFPAVSSLFSVSQFSLLILLR